VNISDYTVDYFITKFSAIPDDQWFVGEFQNPVVPSQQCAYGHCGCTPTEQENAEANILDRLFRDHDLNVACVNDGDDSKMAGDFNHLPTPKARILAALESFK
jgi:hypothetical protein